MAKTTDNQSESRSCPTRLDGAATLFAHRLSPAQCQTRQRKLYHKCFTCAFNNAQVSAHGLPDQATEPAPRRGRRPTSAAEAVGEPKLEPLARIGERRTEQTVV